MREVGPRALSAIGPLLTDSCPLLERMLCNKRRSLTVAFLFNRPASAIDALPNLARNYEKEVVEILVGKRITFKSLHILRK